MKNILFYHELVINAIEKYHTNKNGGFSLLGDDEFEPKVYQYAKDIVAQKSFDMQTKLYYLKLHNDEREFSSDLCACESEVYALKASYESYVATKKVYTLETENWISVKSVESISFEDVLMDKELFRNFKNSFDKCTSYTLQDIKKIPKNAELIWSMEGSEKYHIVKDASRFILPSDAKKSMPFGLSGGYAVMIDKHGKYGLIYTGESLKNDLAYKLVLDFEYHHINLDKFGYAEVQKQKIEYAKDYKSLVCEILNLSTQKTISTNALRNSLSMGTFISVDEEGLLTFHTKDDEFSSKKYGQIMMAYSLKPVQDAQTKLWEYPASSSLYDFSSELPVNGFGHSFESLELVKGE